MNLHDLDIMKFPFLKEGAVLILLFSMFTITFNVMFYTPSKKEIRRLEGDVYMLNKNISNYQALASSSENESKRLQMLLKAYEEVQTRLNLSKDRIPSEKEVSVILKDLSSSRPGLTLISMQTSPIEDKGEYIRLPIVLQLRGGFQTIGPYLAGLENSRRQIGIEHLEMVKDDNSGLSIRMELNIYLIKEDAV